MEAGRGAGIAWVLSTSKRAAWPVRNTKDVGGCIIDLKLVFCSYTCPFTSIGLLPPLTLWLSLACLVKPEQVNRPSDLLLAFGWNLLNSLADAVWGRDECKATRESVFKSLCHEARQCGSPAWVGFLEFPVLVADRLWLCQGMVRRALLKPSRLRSSQYLNSRYHVCVCMRERERET